MKSYFKRVPRSQVLAVCVEQLNAAFAIIESQWERHLKTSGLKLPKKKTGKRYQLAILKHFQGRAVHKEDISTLISTIMDKPSTDQQVRHLKTQYGWFVLNRGDSVVRHGRRKFTPDGCHVLITTRMPLPNSTLQRRATVEHGDWQALLNQYDNRCASCGTRLGEYHRFDSSLKVDTLERGHMNPNKPLETGNIIPQCRWCNRVARSDFVFDEQGRPTAVANIRPVARADTKVIDAIRKWILSKNK